ncbi:hypothetical protein FGB62_77g013 [Gracilaria domingensis]|nr:hypothetical protein FGB62_77g013 [Gracilaria domingensis]
MVVLREGLGQGDVGNADGLADLDAGALGGAHDAISNVLEALDKGAAVHAGAGEGGESASGGGRQRRPGAARMGRAAGGGGESRRRAALWRLRRRCAWRRAAA